MLSEATLPCIFLFVGCTMGISAEWSYEGATITLAHLNISYVDPITGTHHTDSSEVGRFGSGAVGVASGLLVVGQPKIVGSGSNIGGEGSNSNSVGRHGCSLPWASTPPPTEPWVALVSKGGCSDRDKVANALALNASGVLIYAKDAQAHLQKIALSSFSRRIYSTALQRLQRFPVDPATDQGTQQHIGGERGVVVFLAHEQGEDLARMVENGTRVYITITRGQDVKYKISNINRTSVLFVSMSFIILMIVSLAWLIFYYIQRFRYIHAKDRLARHLCNAAKKALSKIPVKNLKSGDKEVTAESECCAICIEPYQVSDTVRILPCKHQFHKCCVDPWLLEHRTCPMCKMDILKFYGYVLSDSEESVLQLDMIEETSGGDVEAQAPAPPSPPPNPRSSSISQVMVMPRPEATGTELSCEGWSESPVPDTPISPVHQPQTAVPPGSATSSVLRSVIDSAKTRVSSSAKVSHSSQSLPSSAVSQETQVASPLPEIETLACLEASGHSKILSQDNKDLELSSICSEDFVDAEDELDPNNLSFSSSIKHDYGGSSRQDIVSCEDSASSLQHSTASCSVPSVQSSATTGLSSKVGSPSHRGSSILPRSTSRSRSLSKRRSSGSRARSTSKRRSASQARSSSRGRSGTRQDPSSHSGSSAASRSSRTQSRPSSHIINVSHI